MKTYYFRRKSVPGNDFLQCDRDRFNELSKVPSLFETRIVESVADEPRSAQELYIDYLLERLKLADATIASLTARLGQTT